MLPFDRSYIRKNATIGDNVWLGHGVLILGGVEIGDSATIIQAGRNPVKVFKYRNKEHLISFIIKRKFIANHFMVINKK